MGDEEREIKVGDLVVMYNNEYHAHRVFRVTKEYVATCRTPFYKIVRGEASHTQQHKLEITQVANITMQAEVNPLKKPQKVFPSDVRHVDMLQLCKVHAELTNLINDVVKERSE